MRCALKVVRETTIFWGHIRSVQLREPSRYCATLFICDESLTRKHQLILRCVLQ